MLSYGHRNLQGVAVQPGTGAVYTAEHGPSFNDEVNRIRPGANYGWDPSQGGTVGGYDESVPMTDRKRFPDAVPAIWQSGRTTQAVCAAEFLEGSQWGGLEGALVVTALKGAKLLLLTLKDDGTLAKVAVPEATNGPYGRLRAARHGAGRCPVRDDHQRRRRQAAADQPPPLGGRARHGQPPAGGRSRRRDMPGIGVRRGHVTTGRPAGRHAGSRACG